MNEVVNGDPDDSTDGDGDCERGVDGESGGGECGHGAGVEDVFFCVSWRFKAQCLLSKAVALAQALLTRARWMLSAQTVRK